MAETLDAWLAERAAPELAAALGALAEGVAGLAARLAGTGALPDAERVIARWLPGSGIRCVSAHGREAVEADPNGRLALALEPLEGDPDLGAAGTIFSLRPAAAGAPEASFLTPGTGILAAGAALYGPRGRLALALGGTSQGFTLNPDAGFEAAGDPPAIPQESPLIATEAGELRRWDRPLRLYVEDCLAGADGPRAADHDLFWSGCLTAELHRLLARGGLLLAPSGAPRLPSLIHHAQPLAFIAESAGGTATDGTRRILDVTPRSLGATSALVVGSPAPVARVAAYHDLPDSETSPLFGQRGLFRF